MIIPFTERVKFEKTDSIMTYRARNAAGRDFFCYIRCGLAGFKQMQEDFTNKITAAPVSYGEVIYTDYLKDPDEKAERFLQNWLAENS